MMMIPVGNWWTHPCPFLGVDPLYSYLLFWCPLYSFVLDICYFLVPPASTFEAIQNDMHGRQDQEHDEEEDLWTGMA
jgi:hypothetical protein